jgi:predicted YcjX-like family ATPase
MELLAEILARIKAAHADRFTDKQARTVQRAVKQLRAQEARRIVIEGAAAISAGLRSASATASATVRPAA